MKSFFKKIGKGLKKLGRNIAKVMNSKIGRIIGTVALAYSMYGIFQAIAKSATQATAQTLAQTGVETTLTEGAGAVATEGAKTVVTEGTKEAVVSTATKNVDSYAGLVTDLSNDVIAATEKTAQGFMDGTVAINDVSSVSKATETGLSLAQEQSLARAEALKTSELLTDSNIRTFGTADATGQATGQVLTEQTANDVLTNKFRDLTGITGDFTPEQQNLLDQYLASQKPGFNDYLANPANRKAYDQATRVFTDGVPGELTAEATKLGMSTSGEIAATPYRTFGEAFASGEGALQKIGNVAEQALSNDIATLTRGAYTGPLSGTSTISAASTASSLLSPTTEEIEMPTQPNYAAAQQSVALQQTAQDLAATPSVAPLMAMPDEMLSSSSPLATFNQIRANAGFGQLYGPLYQFS